MLNTYIRNIGQRELRAWLVSIVCLAPGQRVRNTTQTHLYTETHAQSFSETQTNAPCARVNFCSAPLCQEEEPEFGGVQKDRTKT